MADTIPAGKVVPTHHPATTMGSCDDCDWLLQGDDASVTAHAAWQHAEQTGHRAKHQTLIVSEYAIERA